jgi:hypothetical protein
MKSIRRLSVQSKKVKVADLAVAVLLMPVLAGATVLPKISRSAQQAQPAAATPASSQYRFVTIDGPGTPCFTFLYGVNDTRLVSGTYGDASCYGHGLLWQNGTSETLDYPGAPPPDDTVVGDTSNPGVVVGNYGPLTEQRAATYAIRSGRWTTLPDVPNEPINLGNGINDSGVAVGAACQGNLNVSSNCVGWLWDGSAYSFFSPPGATGTLGTQANAINDMSDVVGVFQDASGVFHGFLKESENYTPIDVPAASGTFAYGINNRGDVSGQYTDDSENYHGFVRSRQGQFTTVDVPGAVQTFLYGINARGDLAGGWVGSSGTLQGFVAFKQ